MHLYDIVHTTVTGRSTEKHFVMFDFACCFEIGLASIESMGDWPALFYANACVALRTDRGLPWIPHFFVLCFRVVVARLAGHVSREEK